MPEIAVKHFEEAMKFARRSVDDKVMRQYEAFQQKMASSAQNATSMRFPPMGAAPSAGTANHVQAMEQDDDLYS